MKLLLILVVIFVTVRVSEQVNGILKSWQTCPGKTYPNYLHIFNFKHLGNYVHRVDVNLSAAIELGNNLKYKTIIYKNNKKLGLNFGGRDVCKGAFAILGEIVPAMMPLLRPKHEVKCPIQKGFYTAKNAVVDAKLIKLPVPLKGNFKIEIPIMDVANNNEVGCLEIIADLF